MKKSLFFLFALALFTLAACKNQRSAAYDADADSAAYAIDSAVVVADSTAEAVFPGE